jgi:formate transporter FocA
MKFDALIPPEMAEKAEAAGIAKAQQGWVRTLILAALAGAFIALGAVFATTVTAGDGIPFGVSRLLGGLVFSLGLVLVILAGAELFTGNNLIVMATASRKVTVGALLRNWGLVYLGNFAGSLLVVVLLFAAEQYRLGGGAVGAKALEIAVAKTELGFGRALALGILCNILVCLAVWLCMGARTAGGKISAILFPISAFVAAGFEHSVANMFFVPRGILLAKGADSAFWSSIGRSREDFSNLSWQTFGVNNLLPVTIGNIIGGAVLVGLVYWFVYLRERGNS